MTRDERNDIRDAVIEKIGEIASNCMEANAVKDMEFIRGMIETMDMMQDGGTDPDSPGTRTARFWPEVEEMFVSAIQLMRGYLEILMGLIEHKEFVMEGGNILQQADEVRRWIKAAEEMVRREG